MTDTSKPAFPTYSTASQYKGMTLREFAAVMALNGLRSNSNISRTWSHGSAAAWAVADAEALIAALQEPEHE